MQDCEAPFKGTRKTSTGGRSWGPGVESCASHPVAGQARRPLRALCGATHGRVLYLCWQYMQRNWDHKVLQPHKSSQGAAFPPPPSLFTQRAAGRAPDRPPLLLLLLLLTLGSLFPVLAHLHRRRREIYDSETRARRYRQHTESGFTFSSPPKKCVVYFPGRGRGRESGPHNVFPKKKERRRACATWHVSCRPSALAIKRWARKKSFGRGILVIAERWLNAASGKINHGKKTDKQAKRRSGWKSSRPRLLNVCVQPALEMSVALAEQRRWPGSLTLTVCFLSICSVRSCIPL